MRKLKIDELNRLSVEAFKATPKISLTIVLDNVRSLNNVGSVFRTADAFLVERIILCGITSTPPHAEIHKTALGAEDSVNWNYFEDCMDAVDELKQSGYKLLAIEQAENSIPLQEFRPETGVKYAVILGNEVKGVQQQVVSASDACLEIPQFGTKHSLNVSITAGIVIWHFANSLLIE
jgi:23S rRNA (guanosine2251-2'-O)-methyltransferase